MKKYIVVTGGVLSGVGKGIFSASLARLLKECGIKVSVLKIDPYLNVDAGTMNPNQHGEVFVTEDGYEADLDLGHYERFLGENMSKKNNITAGQVYSSVVQREREGGYLGSTVQIVPHVTAEIKRRIESLEGDVNVVEIGGTVGDIESEVFLESVRELALEKSADDFLFIHVTYVPYLKASNEFKTKPTQQSVQLLRRSGINPDMIVVRSESPINGDSVKKVALFGGVPLEMVINLPDVPNVYSVVEMLKNYEVHKKIAQRLKIVLDESHFRWDYPKTFKPYKIALVAKYLGTDDAYKSINESVFLSGCTKPSIVDSQALEEMSWQQVCELLSEYDGFIIPGGFGKRGIEGKIRAIRYAREHKKPILGICLGLQLMVIEFARNVAGYESANSTEFDPTTPHPVITLMEEQKKVLQLGGTMRLGAQPMRILRNTKLWQIYGEIEDVSERHRHRYEINHEEYADLFKLPGEDGYRLVISARSNFVEAVELEDHPFFIGIQYHPELKTKVGNPHPLFTALVDSISNNR
ncbi:CTP synthase [Pseudothermotoga sp. U03pept]|uniref:CTP synthase n=1 Tax=Pseudothermotoga sp. U03pept TaxID=3447012 RepID=UPI003EFDEDDD